MEEGLEYAYRLFQEKKENTEAQKQAAYLEQAGFFQNLLKNQSIQADLLRGMRILEENWRDFLKSIGENEKKGISLKMQKHSPWGILLEPGEHRSIFRGRSPKLLLSEAIAVADRGVSVLSADGGIEDLYIDKRMGCWKTVDWVQRPFSNTPCLFTRSSGPDSHAWMNI